MATAVRRLEQLSGPVRAVVRATDASDRVSRLLELGFTQKGVAALTGVNERSVRNWKERSVVVSARHVDLLQEVADIVTMLDGSLTDQGIVQWFNARLRYLGGRRPIELMQEGQIDKVVQAAEAFADGSYL